eukprot:TRINITY_DN11287_c0_g1_i6.p1 TRINITY_DN11287_c0_g1~~TRINITY_DN11287_c0_g1_i6.p1  ORF type:complete len:769 (+),score=163.45 TRINITY_DN11287_c0_g1_i6:373-2679(+)
MQRTPARYPRLSPSSSPRSFGSGSASSSPYGSPVHRSGVHSSIPRPMSPGGPSDGAFHRSSVARSAPTSGGATTRFPPAQVSAMSSHRSYPVLTSIQRRGTLGGVVRSGWLAKHYSGITPRRRYYCILTDSALKYYPEEVKGNGEGYKAKREIPLQGARISVNTELNRFTLVPMDGKKFEFGAVDGGVDSWASDIVSCIRFKSGMARTHSIREHCKGFDKLLENYRTYASSVVDDSDASDIHGLQKCVQNLVDPSLLALSKLEDMPTSETFLGDTLSSIWDHYDKDGDGYLSENEAQTLVKEYLSAIRRHAPNLVEDIIRRVFRLFIPSDKQVPEEYLNTIRSKAEAGLNAFFGSLDIPSISRELMTRLDSNRDGRVERMEFMQAFLKCSEIADLGHAIQSTVGDEIAHQMRMLIDRQLKRPPGTCGLKNLGNTCYMNAAIQCLSATVRLRQFFISGNYKNYINPKNKLGTQGRLANAYATMMDQMWGGADVYSPTEFKRELGRCNEQFAGWGQEDSQELISFLLDRLHEDLNQVSQKVYVELKDPPRATDEQLANIWWEHHVKQNLGVIVSLFHGQLRSVVTCLKCGFVSKAFDPIMYLSLPVSGKGRTTLKDCFDNYMGREEVKGKDEWYCSNCKTHRPFRKEVSLWKLPRYLIVHLKRFTYSIYGTISSKLDTPVDFPLSFSPEPWLARSMEETLLRTPPDEYLAEVTHIPCLSPRTPNLSSPVTSPLRKKDFNTSIPAELGVNKKECKKRKRREPIVFGINDAT